MERADVFRDKVVNLLRDASDVRVFFPVVKFFPVPSSVGKKEFALLLAPQKSCAGVLLHTLGDAAHPYLTTNYKQRDGQHDICVW